MADGVTNRPGGAFPRLVELVATLRGENGCPWDKRQTPETMRVYLVEEMYELLDALDSGSVADVLEELGDVLFQIVFLARLYEEREGFDIDDVADAISDKMVRRHPHVFGDANVKTAEDVRQRWYEFKRGEAKRNGNGKRLLDSVPGSMPILMRAYRIIERVSRLGLTWAENGPQRHLDRLYDGIREAGEHGDRSGYHDLLGRFLLGLVSMSRDVGVHPDSALKDAVNRYTDSFSKVEDALAETGEKAEDVDRDRLWQLWREAHNVEDAETKDENK
ncbi:MAG: nucleoside triphosphate pyrophosphohydrolase [Desulfatibacillaceae bacterium]